MNKHLLNTFQKGFFDLGLGLVLFAIFATTAFIVAPEKTQDQPEHVPDSQQLSSV